MSLLPHLSHPLPPRPPGKKKPNSSVSGGVLLGCSLAVLIVLVFCVLLADAVAKRYRPWPQGLGLTACRGSTPPWSRARVDCGIQIKLKCSDQGTCPKWRSHKKDCSCVLLRLFGFTLSLPKVAGHGGDVGDDSWLKWQSTLLTVLRHSWICRRHRIG